MLSEYKVLVLQVWLLWDFPFFLLRRPLNRFFMALDAVRGNRVDWVFLATLSLFQKNIYLLLFI